MLFDYRTAVTTSGVEQELRADLLAAFQKVQQEWDAFVEGSSNSAGGASAEVWDSMPAIDSKAVTETSPIFEKHLRIPLNPNLIRAGGYTSPEEAVDDLVPKMLAEAATASRVRSGGKAV